MRRLAFTLAIGGLALWGAMDVLARVAGVDWPI